MASLEQLTFVSFVLIPREIKSLQFEIIGKPRYFACDYLWGFKIVILTNLGQLTRDIFRAINT